MDKSTIFNLKSQLPTYEEYSNYNFHLIKLNQDCEFLMDESRNINIIQKEFYNSQFNLLIIFQYQMTSLALWDRYTSIKTNVGLGGFYDLDLFIGGMSKATLNIESLINIKSSFNRSLLIDSWSMFETAITDLSIKYFDTKLIENLLDNCEQYIKLIKILSLKLEKDKESKLKKLLRIKQINKLPIEKRYRELYKLFCLNDYKVEFKKDLNFLKFFLHFRNSMHHNFTYLNIEPFHYEFENVKIDFYYGKKIKFTPEKPSQFYFVDLAFELIAVAERLFVLINNKEGYENLVYNGEVPEGLLNNGIK